MQNSKHNSIQLDALQEFEQNIFKHHKRFTDKTLNHIVYIDKKLWDSPDDAFKQKILSDAENYVYYSAYQHSVDL
jgi:hypothetical protein